VSTSQVSTEINRHSDPITRFQSKFNKEFERFMHTKLVTYEKRKKKDEIAKENRQNQKRQYCYLQENHNYTFQTSIFKNQTCKFPIDKGQSLELISKQAIEMNESNSQVKY
jgi:hypothetical protein